jgi:iron complex outermembrane receptor protein
MYKLFRITLLFAMFLPFNLMAQLSLSGKVVDAESNESLPGAHIELGGRLTVTDANGKYEIRNLQSGDYELKVSYMGYGQYVRKIHLIENLILDIPLTLTTTMQDAVIISASRASDRTGTSFTNLAKADIKRADVGVDLPYILDMTPSLVTSSDAGAGVGYTYMRVRGSDITRINVTVNGVPLNDPESQGVFFVNMPDFAASLNSIQIQRGVGTSVNGPSAFGASIDLQTQGLNAVPRAELGISYGSFNTQRYRAQASSGLIDGKYTFDVRLSQISSDGYIDRASSNLKSYYFSGARYGKNNILRFNIFGGSERTYQAWYGVPKDSLKTNRTYNPYNYEDEVDNYNQTHYQLHFSQKINKRWLFNTALHYTKGYGYFENYKANEDLAGFGIGDHIIGTDTIRSTDLIQQKWLDNDFYGITFNTQYNSRKLHLIIGGAANQYIGDHFGEIIWAEHAFMGKDFEWYRNQGIKNDMNLYAKATYFINKQWNLFGDVQYRRVDYKIDGLHDDLRDLTSNYDFNFLNPKLGTMYRINNTQHVYGSVAVANREPSRGNYRDADAGYRPQPERLVDYEFGYAYNGKKSLFRINFYLMEYTDQLVETGKVNNVGQAIMINVASSYRRGIELIAGYQIHKSLNWNFNATMSQNKILNFTEYVDNWDTWMQESAVLGTTDIAFSPALIVKNALMYTPINGLEISLLSRYISRQYIDNTSNESRSLDPYFVSDLNIAYNFSPRTEKGLSLNFRVNNVFNEEYESFAWVYRYRTGGQEYVMDGYSPQAGINFLAGLTMRF